MQGLAVQTKASRSRCAAYGSSARVSYKRRATSCDQGVSTRVDPAHAVDTAEFVQLGQQLDRPVGYSSIRLGIPSLNSISMYVAHPVHLPAHASDEHFLRPQSTVFEIPLRD